MCNMSVVRAQPQVRQHGAQIFVGTVRMLFVNLLMGVFVFYVAYTTTTRVSE